MRIPLPPGHTRSPELPSIVVPETKPESEVFDSSLVIQEIKTRKAQEHKDPKARMSNDETSYILQKYLKPEHHCDPTVMKFIATYLICRDVKQSARAVGITTSQGNNLRRRGDIHLAIREITEKACLKHGYDASEVIAKVKEIMDTDAADLQKPDGSFIESLHDVAPEIRRAIKKFKCKNEYGVDPNGMRTVTGKIIEIEYWDKMRAVELLGREKDIFKESKVITHDIAKNMSETLLESKKRANDAVAEMRDVTVIEVDGE